MKRSRYDLNDRTAYDGRPTQSVARSPRKPARPVHASGVNGRNGSNSQADPTAGRHVSEPARRSMATTDRSGRTRVASVPGNTNLSASRGGTGLYYWDPSERAVPALERSSAPMVTRPANRRLPASVGNKPLPTVAQSTAKGRIPTQIDQILADAESAGLRNHAMSDRSTMIRNGAVSVRQEPMYIPDGTWPDGRPKFRRIMTTVPVWDGETQDTEE